MNDTITVGIRKIMLLPIYLYRSLISPAIKPRCRYFPSCSEYFELSVMRYGVLRGSLKGIYRILRCNPFVSGGYDPP